MTHAIIMPEYAFSCLIINMLYARIIVRKPIIIFEKENKASAKLVAQNMEQPAKTMNIKLIEKTLVFGSRMSFLLNTRHKKRITIIIACDKNLVM